MAVYKFRVTLEDHEDVCREIEIKSSQSFEDFHNIILKSVEFVGDYDASFFISDDYWRKGEEIILRNLGKDSSSPKRLMAKCKMAALIDDPHQKFVYIYDPQQHWTFLVELLKIVPDDAKATYPKCTKSVGIAPKNVKTVATPPPIDEDEFDEDEPHVDNEAYQNAHAEDEVAELEGEEGEADDLEGAEDSEAEAADEEENLFDNDFGDGQFEED